MILGQIAFVFVFFFLMVLTFGLEHAEKKRIRSLRKIPLPVMIREILEGKDHI